MVPYLALHAVIAIGKVLQVAGSVGDKRRILMAKEINHVAQVWFTGLGDVRSNEAAPSRVQYFMRCVWGGEGRGREERGGEGRGREGRGVEDV